MSDNLTTTTTVSTIPNNTVVATDDCAGVHIQKIKLVDGTADSTAVIPGDATNGLYVNITKHVPGTGATNLGKAVDTAIGGTDTGILMIAKRDDALSTLTPVEGDGVPLHADANGALWCILSAMAQIIGAVAHDTVDTPTNPVKVGARAESNLSGITAVADGDVTNLYAGLDGVQITRPHCNLEDVLHERVTNTDGASTACAGSFAATASKRIYLTDVVIANSSASFCTVDIRDGSAGSVLYTLPVPATGGVAHKFTVPLRFTANTAVAYDASGATTTLTLSFSGFKSVI